MVAVAWTVSGFLVVYVMAAWWLWGPASKSVWLNSRPWSRQMLRRGRILCRPVIQLISWFRVRRHERRLEIRRLQGTGDRPCSVVGEITCNTSFARWLQYHLPPNHIVMDLTTHRRFTRDEWLEWCRLFEPTVATASK